MRQRVRETMWTAMWFALKCLWDPVMTSSVKRVSTSKGDVT
jgi:hypothetical protein